MQDDQQVAELAAYSLAELKRLNIPTQFGDMVVYNACRIAPDNGMPSIEYAWRRWGGRRASNAEVHRAYKRRYANGRSGQSAEAR